MEQSQKKGISDIDVRPSIYNTFRELPRLCSSWRRGHVVSP